MPEHFEIDLEEIPTTCVAANIRRASRTINRLYAGVLKSVDLEPTQFVLLVACCRQASVTISALAERLSMDGSALARNLSVMQRRGLLTVRPGADRRFRNVSITKKGRVVLDQALPRWREVQDKVRAKFGAAQMEAVVASMRSITRAGQDLLGEYE